VPTSSTAFIVPTDQWTNGRALRSQNPSRIWLIAFVVGHLGFQLALLVPWFSGVRAILRSGDFGASLLFLAVVPGNPKVSLPIRAWATAILLVLVLECFHPDGGSVAAVLGQTLLYVAILGPIFWMPRLTVEARLFEKVMLLLWLFYAAGAVVGVLQAYFPGRFQPELSSAFDGMGRDYVSSLQIRLTSGEHIFRPMGLTNVPGGAASGALYAILFGTGVILSPKAPFFGAKAAAILTMLVGAMCLYLCQVRSMVVMTAICLIVMMVLAALSGRVSRLAAIVASVAVVTPAAFMLAVSLAGTAVTDRLGTLVKSDAGTVYYNNRGHFLENTVYHALPKYPLGAGMGHWGMVSAYAGTSLRRFWVEIQWTGWIYDGGVPLVLAYLGAVLASSWCGLQIARGKLGQNERGLSVWAAVVVAYNVGTLALCFNYVPFIGNSGLEFWLINASLICAALNSDARKARPPPLRASEAPVRFKRIDDTGLGARRLRLGR
jgi:hypothetical protein